MRLELVEIDDVVVHAPGDGGTDRLGLLVHLLEHEMREAALLRLLDVPVDVVDHALAHSSIDARHANRRGVDIGNVALLEEDHLPRVRQDGRNIGCQEVLAVAKAHDQRHVQARADEAIRLTGVQDGQRVGAVRLVEGDARGFGDIAV